MNLKALYFFTERTNFSKYVDKKRYFFNLNEIMFEISFLKLVITEQKILSTNLKKLEFFH